MRLYTVYVRAFDTYATASPFLLQVSSTAPHDFRRRAPHQSTAPASQPPAQRTCAGGPSWLQRRGRREAPCHGLPRRSPGTKDGSGGRVTTDAYVMHVSTTRHLLRSLLCALFPVRCCRCSQPLLGTTRCQPSHLLGLTSAPADLLSHVCCRSIMSTTQVHADTFVLIGVG